jgi:Spy/CpxP family protein refolding chaperone
MTRKILVAATALALFVSAAATAARADGPDSSQRPTIAGDDGASRPMMARGTDLRPCKPGTHSEFSRLTGGYRCARNP